MKLSILATALVLSALPAAAETIEIFYNPATPQHAFAAGDIRAALEAHKHTVEIKDLSALKESDAEKRIVIALASDAKVAAVFAAQKGEAVKPLGEQAYALRTTTAPAMSYWVLGGDDNGAMYGAFQVAENIRFDGFTKSYQSEEKPTMMKRGIKLNLPLDKISGTYDTLKKVSDSAKKAIPHVWDMGFWTEWFDEMARNRYNVVSVWNNHPFTSMIKMADYPDAAIQDVTGYDGLIKKMTIDEKIAFWRQVMAYAHSRGFDFYLINWNLFTYGATGKYGITDENKGVTNEKTIAYMRQCMTTLLETYPDLDGFGVTQGEHMSDDEDASSLFLAKTYGLGMHDYASRHPERKLRFIHRWHMADFSEMKKNFSELMKLPNVTFDMSYKYSKAHMYATPAPRFMGDSEENALRENNLKSWLTVRNDSFFFLHWGDPEFVRAYLAGIPGQGEWFRGMLMGSDGFCPTKVFYSKHSVTQGQLEVQRRWYMSMLWGRLAYNPATSDDVFKTHLRVRFPKVDAEDLFQAWSKASRGLPKANEIVHGKLKLDFQWWPEACQSHEGFIKVKEFADAGVARGSKLSSMADTADDKSKGRKDAYAVADEIEADAAAALAIAEKIHAEPNTDLGVTMNSIRSMSFLSLYYAHKIRAGTRLKAGQQDQARDALGTAYVWWIKYSTLMDSMFTGMTMQRSEELPDWHTHDAAVLKEYTDLGGKGTPTR